MKRKRNTRNAKRLHFLVRLQYVCISIAVISLFACGYLLWQQSIPWQFTDTVIPTHAAYGPAVPVGLMIPELGISLPVSLASIDAGKWEKTSQGISYLMTSTKPGERGNSIFYGHNWPNLLGKLPNIQKGNRISVAFSNGDRRDFFVANTSVVTADQTHVLEESDDARLTIYTCTGLLDEKRFVVTATEKV